MDINGKSALVPGGASGLGLATSRRLQAMGATDQAPLAVTVNCADIGNVIRVVAKDGSPFPFDAFRRVVEVNLVGTFNVIRMALR
jgi:NAD(P)-dependent dehydrogenase (short-subunit alcohol dehydrogenase family)